jgi:hypothetical protein
MIAALYVLLLRRRIDGEDLDLEAYNMDELQAKISAGA